MEEKKFFFYIISLGAAVWRAVMGLSLSGITSHKGKGHSGGQPPSPL